MTITQAQQEAIATFLADRHIPAGLGTKEEACSIAAINLALSGELTDSIPECMSLVIGKWIIGIQDVMPDAMRNSAEWRALLPLAAGTGRKHEAERSAMLLDWVWDVVLPEIQPVADAGGFGAQWKTMTSDKTADAAWAAARGLMDAARTSAKAARAADAAKAAWATAKAVKAAKAAWAADAAWAAALAADPAWAAAWAADAAKEAARAADCWAAVNPIHVLQQLIAVGNNQ